jgi:hypothetical protein
MTSPDEWSLARDAALKELYELGMKLARSVAADAEAAETPQARQRCADTFERASRSVRLTFSLRSRLVREAQLVARDEAAGACEAVETRRKQLRAALLPAVRATAAHLGERFERESELDDRLAEAALQADFTQAPVQAVVARIREDLGLPPDEPANDPHVLSPPPPAEIGTTKTTKGALPLARAGPS